MALRSWEPEVRPFKREKEPEQEPVNKIYKNGSQEPGTSEKRGFIKYSLQCFFLNRENKIL
jgi:hypothetical protein